MPELPVESLDAQQRCDLRDRHHCVLASFDRSRPESQVLGEIAARSLGLQHKLEDLLFAIKSVANPPPSLLSAVTGVRASVTDAAAVFGLSTAAARYDCASVAASLDIDDLPGLSPDQLHDIRSAYSSNLAAAAVTAHLREPLLTDELEPLDDSQYTSPYHDNFE